MNDVQAKQAGHAELSGPSLQWQVVLSFAPILLILLVLGTLGYFGVSRLDENFRSLGEITDSSTAILELDRSIVELRNNVQAFIFTGHEGVAERVAGSIGEVEASLAAVRELALHEAEQELLARMVEHLANYKSSFASAREERSLGRELLKERIVNLRERLSSAFLTEFSGERLTETEQQEVRQTYLAVERNLYAYLADPDYTLLERSSEQIFAIRKLLDRAGAAEISGLLGEYRQVFTRIVQATRAYLYLTSVVMAAESEEFARVSTQLREMVLSRMAPVRADVRDVSRIVQIASWAGTLAALILGLVLSTAMARRLTRPILDMTRTFNELASGAHGIQIPHMGRNDEIGELAAAANVFRTKNEETVQLLEHSRNLTGELEKRETDLTDINQQLEEFVFTVSHDLKSPIVISLNYLGVMRRLADQGKPEEAIAKLGVLERSLARMKRLVDDLLDLSRVGRVDTECELLDMNEVLAGVREQYLAELPRYRAELVIQPDLPAVFANETRMVQVFDNLIRNALKYGGTENGCRVEVGAERRTGGVEYFVRDQGQGIAPKYHQKVFELFHRLDQEHQGTGVGLSIVEKVMRGLGGYVRIDSQGTGDGTRFLLWFPDRDDA